MAPAAGNNIAFRPVYSLVDAFPRFVESSCGYVWTIASWVPGSMKLSPFSSGRTSPIASVPDSPASSVTVACSSPAYLAPPHVHPPHVAPPHVVPLHMPPPHLVPSHMAPPHVAPLHMPPPHLAPLQLPQGSCPAAVFVKEEPRPTSSKVLWLKPAPDRVLLNLDENNNELSSTSNDDPRFHAEVHHFHGVTYWNKDIQCEKGYVAVHVRHENYTVEPCFPGRFDYILVPGQNDVVHVCVPIELFGSQVQYGMYLIWLSCFGTLLSVTGDHWALVPCQQGRRKPAPSWRTFTASAKVRFRCTDCGNAWTSMHGMATFQFFLNRSAGAGTAFVQLPGQDCSQCGVHAMPMWYGKEVRRVLGELQQRVLGKLYPQLNIPALVYPRQMGYPKGTHRQDLCAGCRTGCCLKGWAHGHPAVDAK